MPKKPSFTKILSNTIQEEGMQWEYNGSFTINLERFIEVAEIMMPLFYKNQNLYNNHSVNPEDVFKQLPKETEEQKKQLSQYLFLSSFFDLRKISQEHYFRDMQGLINIYNNQKLYDHVNRLVNGHGTLFPEQVPQRAQTGDLLADINTLNDKELNFFIRKTHRSTVTAWEKYQQKKKNDNKTNMRQEHFKQTLKHLKENYDNDPRNIYLQHKGPALQEALLEFQGISIGLAYLGTAFHERFGLLPYTKKDIHLLPKIDQNDIIISRLTGILEVHKESNHDPITQGLSKAMLETAEHLNIPVMDLDYAFWATSQLHRIRPELHKKTPGGRIVSASALKNFAHSDYYGSSYELPVPEELKQKLFCTKHFEKQKTI